MSLEIWSFVIEIVICIGVWAELYITLEKRRRAQIKRFVTITLKKAGIYK